MGYWRYKHHLGAVAAFSSLLSLQVARPADEEDSPTPPACYQQRDRSLGRMLAEDFVLDLGLIQDGRLELDGFER